MTVSGNTPCACRDCMDICVTADGGWTLCLLCLDAGCAPWPGPDEDRPVGFSRIPAHEYECQRDDAYGADCP